MSVTFNFLGMSASVCRERVFFDLGAALRRRSVGTELNIQWIDDERSFIRMTDKCEQSVLFSASNARTGADGRSAWDFSIRFDRNFGMTKASRELNAKGVVRTSKRNVPPFDLNEFS